MKRLLPKRKSAQLLTQAFRDRIQDKIVELEKLSSLEFVPVIVNRASSYLLFRRLLVLSVAFVLFVLLTATARQTPLYNLGWSVTIAAMVGILTGFDPVLRWMIPKGLKFVEVEEAAHRAFLKEEVFATRQRTGILIFISEMERAVFLLADKGVSTKVPQEQWAELGRQLAKDFGRQSAGDTFLQALQLLSERLASDFPPEHDNSDELANRVREQERDTFH